MYKKYKVQGYIDNCSGYDPCPLCFGCRNYGLYNECESNCGGKQLKFNACTNRKLHNERNYAKMLSRPKAIEIIVDYKYKE